MLPKEHPVGIEECPKPRPRRRRWRNTLWVCPICQQAYVSRFDNAVEWGPPGELSLGLTHSAWNWWRWPSPERNLTSFGGF